jgi:broad specificity phosphatase PhoE
MADGPGKMLCLIRHGQGEHNPRKNPLALKFIPAMFSRDAPLTAKGRRQAEALQQPMSSLPFDLIVVSPLSRTIETATEAFGTHPTPKMLCALMCERTTMPADQGTPKAQLLRKHPQLSGWLGFDELPEEFWPARSLKSAEAEVAERVSSFKQWLLARPEACIALVGHSAFFSTFTGLPKLANCEAFWCELRMSGEVVACNALPPPPSAD